MTRTRLIGLVVALGALAAASGASAQVTAEQQSAIRASCRSDFMSKCSGVTPGGKDALLCLQKNVASLAPACKTAVSATIPAPAPPPPAAAAKPAAPAPTPAAAAPPPQPPPPPAAAASAPPPPAPKPSQATITAAPPPRAALPARPVAPKPPQAQTQSPPPPPAAAQQAVVAPSAAPPPPAARRPNAPVVMTAVIGRACLRDLALHCRGSGIGDGQKIACLTARGDKLAPACKVALKITDPVR